MLLRGMNSVTKGAPFVSVDSGWLLGAPEREYLRRSGLNSVRLGVTAAAIMPEPGRIDDTYLDLVVDTVDALAADGFWIQLDLHQDVFNQMPDWATPPSAAALSDDAPELFSFIGWAAGYLSPRSIVEWDSFLAGEPHVGGRSVASVLGDALAALAVRAADEPHVIGIELLNEPFSGSDVARCVLEGCPGLEAGLLVERYEEMASRSARAAPELPIWVELFAPTGDRRHRTSRLSTSGMRPMGRRSVSPGTCTATTRTGAAPNAPTTSPQRSAPSACATGSTPGHG